LQCPPGESACIAQDAPPEGDGCGDELTSWLPPNYRRPAPSPPREPPILPSPCQALLGTARTSRAN
jgi:penicillin-insensitive murein endopeptidase